MGKSSRREKQKRRAATNIYLNTKKRNCLKEDLKAILVGLGVGAITTTLLSAGLLRLVFMGVAILFRAILFVFQKISSRTHQSLSLKQILYRKTTKLSALNEEDLEELLRYFLDSYSIWRSENKPLWLIRLCIIWFLIRTTYAIASITISSKLHRST